MAPAGQFTELRQEVEQPGTMSEEEVDRRLEEISEGGETSAGRQVLGAAGMVISVLFAVIGFTLMQGVLTKSVSEAYLGHEISVGEAYRFVWPKFMTLLGAGILVGLTCLLGYVLLIVPGVIFSLWYSMTTPAIVAEDLKASAGMSRSKALAKGNLGKIFCVVFLAGLLAAVIEIPFSIAGNLAGAGLSRVNPHLAVLSIQLLQTVGQVIAAPISAGALILLYYDLRIRKEGFDLEMLAQQMSSGQGGEYVEQQY
jgi:hypothetical protein